MREFEQIMESKARIGELKIEVLKLINSFSDKHPYLTMNEVGAVMLEVLSDANNKKLKQQHK